MLIKDKIIKKDPMIPGKLNTRRKLLEFFDYSSFAIFYILEIEKNDAAGCNFNNLF